MKYCAKNDDDDDDDDAAKNNLNQIKMSVKTFCSGMQPRSEGPAALGTRLPSVLRYYLGTGVVVLGSCLLLV